MIGFGFRGLALAGVLVLAACAEGDLDATSGAAVTRAITVSETHTRLVRPGNWVRYTTSCVHNARLADASARIVAVSGRIGAVGDYELRQDAPAGRNSAFAWVRPARDLPERAYVTVEQTLVCQFR